MTEFDKESSTEKVEKEKIAATKLSTSRTHKLQASNLVDLAQKKAKGDVGRVITYCHHTNQYTSQYYV